MSKEIRRSSQPCPRAVSHANLLLHRPSQARLDPEQAPSSVKDHITFLFGAARRVDLTQGLFYFLATTFTGATSLEHHLRGLCQQLTIMESDYRLCACAANVILGSNLARLDPRDSPRVV